MAETTWSPQTRIARKSSSRAKFYVGGFIIIAALVYLIVSGAAQSAQFFLTIDELNAKGPDFVGKDVRVSGAVLGESIQYDPKTLKLTFTVANVTNSNAEIEQQGGLAEVLAKAVKDPNAARMQVVYEGPKPDLLRHEAQAIMTGQLGEDGVFRAHELLLKCPTRYEDAVPSQSTGE
jgi:cytochrome c-type biogenesis protein CcmE